MTGISRAMDLMHGLGMQADGAKSALAAAKAVITEADPGARFLSPEEAKAIEVGASTVSNQTGAVVQVDCWSNQICHIKMQGLSRGTGAAVADQVRTACSNLATGIILDLRGAGGADLASVDAIAGLFVESGSPLFKVNDFHGSTVESHKAAGSGRMGVPAVVLIDGQTQGAAEVLAACLRGVPGILLAGDNTCGEPVLRKVVWLDSGTPVLIGFRRIVCERSGGYTGGVRPDITIAATNTTLHVESGDNESVGERAASQKPSVYQSLVEHAENDAALTKAVDVLLSLKALGLHESKQ